MILHILRYILTHFHYGIPTSCVENKMYIWCSCGCHAEPHPSEEPHPRTWRYLFQTTCQLFLLYLFELKKQLTKLISELDFDRTWGQFFLPSFFLVLVPQLVFPLLSLILFTFPIYKFNFIFCHHFISAFLLTCYPSIGLPPITPMMIIIYQLITYKFWWLRDFLSFLNFKFWDLELVVVLVAIDTVHDANRKNFWLWQHYSSINLWY